MPGIVGLVTRMPPARAESELRLMLGVMQHESFYSSRIWSDQELGVYVGWTALRGSFSDANPRRNESSDAVLVFSGEEFPAPDTIQRLRANGHQLGDESSSYLIHLYEEDPAFPVGLNGMFHGVVADRRRGRVVLFNDRYGLHRLYLHESGEAFYFAAEAKAILAVRPELRRIDPRGLGEFITLGCVLENRSLFEGIQVLPAASRWRFELGALRDRATYFQPREWEEQPKLESEAAYRALREVFARNLPRYFEGRERIGMSLTGGLDTRAIMAWQRCPLESLPCYTWDGSVRECRDAIVARDVARTCRQPHQAIRVDEQFLSRFPYYADRAVFLTDGGVGVSRSADLWLNQQAREIAPVRMTGLYGGEVLRHARAFKPALPMPGLYRRELHPYFAQAHGTYARLSRGSGRSLGFFQDAAWHHVGNLALEQTQITVRSPFLDSELVQTAFRIPDPAGMSDAAALRLIADGDPALSRIPTDLGEGGRGALSHLAAHSLQRFLVKSEYAYDYGMPQWLASLDRLIHPLHVERLFLGRHRFQHFRTWYRGRLSSYVREMLLDTRSLSRDYLEPSMVERIVLGHRAGTGNYTTEIHTLLTLELLHRNFVDAPLTAGGGSPARASA